MHFSLARTLPCNLFFSFLFLLVNSHPHQQTGKNFQQVFCLLSAWLYSPGVVSPYICIYTCINIHTRVFIHTYIYTHIHICIYKYIFGAQCSVCSLHSLELREQTESSHNRYISYRLFLYATGGIVPYLFWGCSCTAGLIHFCSRIG